MLEKITTWKEAIYILKLSAYLDGAHVQSQQRQQSQSDDVLTDETRHKTSLFSNLSNMFYLKQVIKI